MAAAPSAQPSAPSGIRPPPPLNLHDKPIENWKLFQQSWKNYNIITGISRQNVDYQRAMFLHCIGTEALSVYNTFKLPETDDTTLEVIIEKFEQHIVGETNETYERYKFNQRCQQPEESIDQFVTALKTLAATCNFCDCLQESLIRDRVVTGIRKEETRKKLLEERKLTLHKAIDICRSAETSSSQLREMSTRQTETADTVKKVAHSFNKKNFKHETGKLSKCKYCGGQHAWDKKHCPAYGNRCRKCGGANHFAKMCRTKSSNDKKGPKHHRKVHAIGAEYDSEDYSSDRSDWINAVGASQSKTIKCKMIVKGKPLAFLIDSGATVNTLPEKFATHLVSTTQPSVKAYGNTKIQTIGISRQTIINPKNNKSYSVEFVVMKNDAEPVIGLKAAQQMRLIEIREKNFEHINNLTNSATFQDGVGSFPGKQKLSVDPSVQPVVMPDKRIPIALRTALKTELTAMVEQGIITEVSEPTPWVSQLVVVKKPSGKLRICLDPRFLNKALRRERYTMPILDEVIHELSQSTVFTKVDIKNAYWHVILDEESSMLTTFQTCFGRYRFLRLPFGLNVSAEIFERKVRELFGDMTGVVCLRDDIIVHGATVEDHNKHLQALLQKCDKFNIKLNKSKLELAKDSVSFMGHVISKSGIHTDPRKVKAICDLPTPKITKDIRRILGMVQYMSRFVPNLTDIVMPMQNLLKNDVPFNWSETQQSSFEKMKEAIVNSPTLAIFNDKKDLTLENDASEYGLGSVLLQEGKPLGFASRTLTSAEQNYAQIEKEMLAVTFGLKKFHQFTYGRPVNVITDHKPLVSISKKPLCKAPKRLQSMFLKAQEYDYELSYLPGSELVISDCLSRAPLKADADVFTVNNLQDTPFKDSRLEEVREATDNDPALSQVREIILQGWPDSKRNVPAAAVPYFNFRDEMTVQDGIVMRGDLVVIPQSLRQDMKNKVHMGHQGMNSCLRRAREVIYWPGISKDIRAFVESCNTCATYCTRHPEQPIQSHEVPSQPWQKIGTDIFTIQGRNYLVTVDYFSQFIELDYLPDTLSSTVIYKIKHHFARHGIPLVVISDNGPQFSSAEFSKFAKSWGFTHNKIAPGNSRANGEAEAAVKIMKNMMKKCLKSNEDPYIGLLNLRNTPNEGMSTSPVQRLMGRRTQSILPSAPSVLKPSKIPILKERSKMQQKRQRSSQRENSSKPLPKLNIDAHIRMEPIDGSKEWRSATVTKQLPFNNYEVHDGQRSFIRARKFLRKKEPPSTQQPPIGVSTKSPGSPAQQHTSHELVSPSFRVSGKTSPHTQRSVTSTHKTTGTTGSTSSNSSDQFPPSKGNALTSTPATQPESQQPVATRTRLGRLVKPPKKLNM